MYDRPYMQTSFDQRSKNVLLWLIGINVGVFVLQQFLKPSGIMEHLFALNRDSLARGFIWTPITYAFLHSTQGFFHILVNMLGVFFLGRAILPVLGTPRFLQLYMGTAVVGALFWLGTTLFTPAGQVVGASAAVTGLLGFFAALYPNRDIHVLLFFVLPVRVKPKILAYIVLAISAMGMFFFELTGRSPVAHSAHLGGLVGGYLFYRLVYLRHPGFEEGGRSFEIPKWLKPKRKSQSSSQFQYSVNITKPRDLQVEVDRILDKINSKGFGSLTSEEKRILDEARDVLKRR